MKNFYGFLTNKGKNIFLITLLSSALLFASCINDLFNDYKSSKKQEAQTEQTGSEELIPVKINISNQKQIENILQNVKPQKNISQARAASPQNVTLAYKILYKKVTETSPSSTVTAASAEYTIPITDSASAKIELSKGTWDFTLIVYFNEIVLFTGDVLNEPINSGKDNSLTFTLKEVEGKGNLLINLIIPKSNEYTTEVKVQLKTYPWLEAIAGFEQTLTPANTDTTEDTYIYSKKEIQNGMYFAVFTITTKNSQAASESETAANSTETTTYPVLVRVVTNLTSESTETLTDIRNVCVITYALGTDGTVSWKDGTTLERVYKKHQNVTLPTYESLNPIETKIFKGWKVQGSTDSESKTTMIIEQNVTLTPDWITTTLYVDGSATDTEPDALTESKAVKTLQDAVNKLIDYEKLDGDSYQHEWTINVNGSCDGTSDLSSLKITKLTITGDNNTQDILDGSAGTGSVITNAGTYPLFIENLTIQNGSNTSGGGLNITNSTAYLNKVVLINNTASENGGAIALTNSKLFIYGGCHIGPDVATDVATDTACSNKAGGNGGGIWADKDSTIYFGYTDADETDETNVTLTAETGIAYNNITYNYAGVTQGGGGICCLGKLYINGGTISYNSAANGGGIYYSSDKLYISGTTISGNKATSGGGIFYYKDSKAYLTDTLITNNNATYGGGIFSGENSELYIRKATKFTSNSGTKGGAVCTYKAKIIIQEQEETKYAYIEPNPDCNDVCLQSAYCQISIESALSVSNHYFARITPPIKSGGTTYNDEPVYLTGDENKVKTEYKKFQVTPQSGTNTQGMPTQVLWETTSAGKIKESNTTFVKIPGKKIDTPVTDSDSNVVSGVFITGRELELPSFYICDHEVTQGEYEQYCTYGWSPGTTAADWNDWEQLSDGAKVIKGDNYPACFVSWYDALIYCNLRSMAEGLEPVYYFESSSPVTDPENWDGVQWTTTDGKTRYCGPADADSWPNIKQDRTKSGWRLPVEAEWEYAARGANGASGTEDIETYLYSGSDTLKEVAWMLDNEKVIGEDGKYYPHEVKGDGLKPNRLGLYDMSGNVVELCWDWYSDNLEGIGVEGPVSGEKVAAPGGAYQWPRTLKAFKDGETPPGRSSNSRNARFCNAGFRIVRTITE